MSFVKENKGYWKCQQQGHRYSECKITDKCGINGCDKRHHKALHLADASGIRFSTKGKSNDGTTQQGCMVIMQVNAERNMVNVIWDTAATISLITRETVKRLQLKPKCEVNLSIEKTGGIIDEVDSQVFEVPLKKREGTMEWIEVYSIEKIASSIDAMRWETVLELFRLSVDQINIPTGEIDILIGMNYAAFHPRMVEANGQLVLYRNSFGMCLGGSHPCLKNGMNLAISNAKVNHVQVKSVSQFVEIEVLETRYSGLENIGDEFQMIMHNKECTLKEYREFTLMDQGLKLEGARWYAAYPWVRDPSELPDNKQVA